MPDGNVLNYKKAFGKHRLDAMAGSSWTQSKWSQNYINARGRSCLLTLGWSFEQMP